MYCALLGYIIFEGAEEDRNLNTLVDMISGMEVKEDDEDFLNAVDYMFKGLEQRKPNCFAVKQYKKYKLSSGVVCSKRLLNQAVGKSLRTHNPKSKKGAQVMRKNEKITALYERLSRDDFGKDDDQQRESNSISNQKAMLEEFAARQGFTNIVHFTDDAKVDYNFGGDHWNLSVGRTDTYVLGGENAYGFQYGDVFDRAELKYTNDHFVATAGYGKFKAGDTVEDAAVAGNGLLGVKTGYGELEGFFGGGRAAGSAVGVYYNDFNGINGFKADDLWGAYASLNFGKWNALANYEKINNDVTNDPEVWIGKLTYGSADSDARGSWDAWVEYINSDKGALLGGATNSWRDDSVLDNVKSWGVGIDYTLAKNVILTAAQTFGTQTKHGNAADPDEFTDVEINFLF